MTRTAGQLAEFLQAELLGDPATPISGVAKPESAHREDLIYVQAPKYAEAGRASEARCLIVPAGLTFDDKTTLQVKNPKLAFAKAAAWLLPKFAYAPGIHPTAVIARTARIAPSAHVGAYVVIEDAAEIGANTVIEPFCFIGRGSKIGEDCHLHPRVTLYAGAKLANRVELHSGAVIGGDGFGYVPGEGRHWKFPQLGSIAIGNDVEIGCNTTIDRGSLDETQIDEGVKIDNLVQVGHNVHIGAHSIVVSQVGISGSCTFGKNVVIGGQAGFGEKAVVEDGAIIGGQSGVLGGKIVRKGQVVWGTPARPLAKFKEQFALLGRLPDLVRRMKGAENPDFDPD